MWELAYMQGRCAPVLCDGEYLRDQLKARNLTLEQAAEACEVSKAAVHSWCAGIKPIPQARRELLAAKFGIII
jgi:transcriptional regulator with XRE-family HTH domain